MIRTVVLSLICLVPLSACGTGVGGVFDRIRPGSGAEETGTPAPATDDGAPLSALTNAPPPPADAATAEEFDTTTTEERQAALSPQDDGGARLLGTTVTSLGDPAEPGFWMETPLVSEIVQGRVDYAATGNSVTVELRPSGGEPGSGSRLSLAAFRLLGAPLTDLPVLSVFAL